MDDVTVNNAIGEDDLILNNEKVLTNCVGKSLSHAALAGSQSKHNKQNHNKNVIKLLFLFPFWTTEQLATFHFYPFGPSRVYLQYSWFGHIWA